MIEEAVMYLRFAIPNGSLQERTLEVLRCAGYPLPMEIGRDDYFGKAGGVEFSLRDRENIATLVATGKFDAGITGSDLKVNAGFQEDDPALPVVMDLPYGRDGNNPTRWVLAASAKLGPLDWIKMTGRKIGTERPGLARYCMANELRADDEIVELPGKEEAAVGDGLCDAVFVVTETGKSLKAHNLEVLRVGFTSTPQLLARPGLDEERLGTVRAVGLAMRAILEAADMVIVSFDILKTALDNLKLACAVSPTVNQTMDPDWCAGQVLIPRRQFGQTLLELERAGAKGTFMQEVQGYKP